jgi:hypothetical protein
VGTFGRNDIRNTAKHFPIGQRFIAKFFIVSLPVNKTEYS